MPSTKHSKESVVLGILERQSLWEQRLSIRDVANLETSTCEQRVDSCSVDVPASFQSNRRATELRQIIKPFNRGLDTWIRLGCSATKNHSAGMARGARDSSESCSKDPKLRHRVKHRTSNPKTLLQRTTAISSSNTTTRIENRSLGHT